MKIDLMEENYILFEGKNQMEVYVSDAWGLLVLFWNYNGAGNPEHPKLEVRKRFRSLCNCLSPFRWKKKALYKGISNCPT